MRHKVTVIVMLCGAALAVAQTRTAKPNTAPAGDAHNGKKLYTSYGCWECHGREAQGAITGKRLAPRPMPYQDFLQYCRHPTGEMPPYTTKVVSDREIADIYAFLLTIPEPRKTADKK